MDPDYLAFGALMVAFGIVGMTATATVSPGIFASPTCDCIPSSAARLQGLSLIAFDIGVVLVPIGLLRRPSAFGGASHGTVRTPSGRAYAGAPIRSGGLLSLGVSLMTFGVATAVSSVLVLRNNLLIVEAAGMIAVGLYLSRRGGRAS